mgnify:CR=1 FL=1
MSRRLRLDSAAIGVRHHQLGSLSLYSRKLMLSIHRHIADHRLLSMMTDVPTSIPLQPGGCTDKAMGSGTMRNEQSGNNNYENKEKTMRISK